jgi:hypothetical protein
VAVAEGASVQVTVLMDGSPVPGSPFTFLRDCVNASAKAVSNCDERGADIVLVNSGQLSATLQVTKNGTLIDTVVVPAGDAVFRLYPLDEDEIALFRVTGPDFDSGSLIVTQDCAQVSAPPIVTVAPPSRLALTGGLTEPLALTGALFVGVGTGALLASMKRKGISLG